MKQISDGVWIGKGGLRIPDDVVAALQQKHNWLNGRNSVAYAEQNLPDLKAILNFFPVQYLSDEVEFAATEILQSCYGANKVVNSKAYSNPEAIGLQKLNAIASQSANPDDYTAAVEVNNFLINWQNIVTSNYTNNDDIFTRIKAIEDVNKGWFGSKLDNIREEVLAIYDNLLSQLDNLEAAPKEIKNHFIALRNKAAQNFNVAIEDFPQDRKNLATIILEIFEKLREELAKILEQIKNALFGKYGYKEAVANARKERWEKVDAIKSLRSKFINFALNEIRKLLTKGRKVFELKDDAKYKDNLRSQFGNIASNYGAIAPVPSPTNLDVYNVLGKIAESLLSTFLLRGAKLPWEFFQAVKNTVVSVITKRFAIPAGEAIRYITGGLLRSVKDLLPAVFNNTGMFAGAWGMLTACAPYILSAAIIIAIAINMAKKNQLGNFIWLLGLVQNQTEPDVCFARISGDSLERMEDIKQLKSDFLEETNKKYNSLYVLSFKNEELGRSFNFKNKNPEILPEETALTIKAGFSGLEYMPF
ncbi:hypothetical protein [Nodularia spumigena]|uniref:hypothetical protein n=1 Tax=Nodularia spumigena TaxID=70799 RepID=UPI00232F0137|nr:hypothetical protein [Nodularia spumigena]MDB9318202.1 hypothetical protein [Nodularia spumigena CS-590/01A]MDB9328027.1 hypothetical protein [Nodularia spumigena CS-590/02]MDB9334312.1 hypothetical protein [Nodularia spumigena CS-590/01]